MPGANEALRIAAEFNVGPIQSGMAESAAAVEAGSARMKQSFQEVAETSEYSATEARHALHGLGEEIGVHMPRFVQSFVAHLGGIGPLMAAAFTPIAVIGLLEVLEHVPEAIQNGIDKLAGFDTEMKKVMGDARAENIKLQIEQLKMSHSLAEIAASGLKGPERIAAEMRALGADTKATGELMGEFVRRQNELRNENDKFDADAKGWAWGNILLHQFDGTKQKIEENKKGIEDYQKAIDQLKANLRGTPKEKARLGVEDAAEKIRLQNELVDMNHRNEESVRQLADTTHRLADEEKHLAEEKQLWGASVELKEYEKKRKFQEEIAAADERYTKAQTDLKIESLQKTPALERAAIDQEMKAITGRLERERELNAKSYAEDLARYEELQRKKAQIDRKEEAEVARMLKTITGDFNRSFIAWMNGQESFGRAMQRVWTNFADTVVNALLKAGFQMLANIILQKALLDSTKINDANAAARKTYTSVAAIPYVGPFLAPEAAAAAFAAVMAFEKGGIVPKDTPALLHANEMVLPAHISQAVQASAATGGMGGHTFNYTYKGSGSRADGQQSHKDFMKVAMRELRRRGMATA